MIDVALKESTFFKEFEKVMKPAVQTADSPEINTRLVPFFHALLFVVGFSAVFIVGWGGAATLIGQVFGYYKEWLGRIGGVVITLFRLSTLGLFRLPWMIYRDTRPQWTPGRGGGVISSVMRDVDVRLRGWRHKLAGYFLQQRKKWE